MSPRISRLSAFAALAAVASAATASVKATTADEPCAQIAKLTAAGSEFLCHFGKMIYYSTDTS